MPPLAVGDAPLAVGKGMPRPEPVGKRKPVPIGGIWFGLGSWRASFCVPKMASMTLPKGTAAVSSWIWVVGNGKDIPASAVLDRARMRADFIVMVTRSNS
jgi:hypothetical protein